uniref:D-aminoacyl-tRNA deacylase 1 n=1 Tax=Oncorhynchus tshawytscha TaxID=74940 RepID=A0A8C8K1D0_ONCTS
MKAIIQRVTTASVTVGEVPISSIGRGLCVLLGISMEDTQKDVDYMVRKILNLRLFDDENGRAWSKSVMDKEYEVLCVSQFTLQCILKGNKPDFHAAMPAELSQPFYNNILEHLRSTYKPEMIKGRAHWSRILKYRQVGSLGPTCRFTFRMTDQSPLNWCLLLLPWTPNSSLNRRNSSRGKRSSALKDPLSRAGRGPPRAPEPRTLTPAVEQTETCRQRGRPRAARFTILMMEELSRPKWTSSAETVRRDSGLSSWENVWASSSPSFSTTLAVSALYPLCHCLSLLKDKGPSTPKSKGTYDRDG